MTEDCAGRGNEGSPPIELDIGGVGLDSVGDGAGFGVPVVGEASTAAGLEIVVVDVAKRFAWVTTKLAPLTSVVNGPHAVYGHPVYRMVID